MRPECKYGHGIPYEVNCPRCVTNNNIRLQNKRRADLAALKLSFGCVDCGYNQYAEALDFDHRDPSAKSFNISDSHTRSLPAVMAEVEKCDVVCSNCHRHRTWLRRRNGGE